MNIDAEMILITAMVGGMAWIARDLLNTSKVLAELKIRVDILEDRYDNKKN